MPKKVVAKSDQKAWKVLEIWIDRFTGVFTCIATLIIFVTFYRHINLSLSDVFYWKRIGNESGIFVGFMAGIIRSYFIGFFALGLGFMSNNVILFIASAFAGFVPSNACRKFFEEYAGNSAPSVY